MTELEQAKTKEVKDAKGKKFLREMFFNHKTFEEAAKIAGVNFKIDRSVEAKQSKEATK